MLNLSDTAAAMIHQYLGLQQPEQGGALLGLPDAPWVTHFISDPSAERTAVSYVPSRALASAIGAAERAGGFELKGIVHSHPAGVEHLSGPDHAALAHWLAQNPHLPALFAPVVNLRGARVDDAKHQLALGEKVTISCYVARRAQLHIDAPVNPAVNPVRLATRSLLGFMRGKVVAEAPRRTPSYSDESAVDIRPCSARILPVMGPLLALITKLESAAPLMALTPLAVTQGARVAYVHGVPCLNMSLAHAHAGLDLYFSSAYPLCAPTARVWRDVGAKRRSAWLPLRWRICAPENLRLEQALPLSVLVRWLTCDPTSKKNTR